MSRLFLDILAQRNAIRSYVLAAYAMQGRADAARELLDAEGWRLCQRWADRLFKTAELEEQDPTPACVHGLMEKCVACQWEDQ